MKKLLIALTLCLPLMFVSCEKKEETIPTDNNNNNNNNPNSGFWDVECNLVYDSIPTTTCDSVWVNDSSAGQWEVQCDTILGYDSLQNTTYVVDCKQVFVPNGGYYSSADCITTYSLNTVQICDSVWVNDNNNGGTDSTNNSGGNGTTGSWELECDSVYGNNNQLTYECDSVYKLN